MYHQKLAWIIATCLMWSTTSSNANTPSEESLRGITFAGGGFRAHAVASGVMAGFLEAASRKSGKSEFTFSELMHNFHSVASNSGGSWFTAQMIYSENFVQLLEDISKVGDNAMKSQDLFAHGWVDKFLAESGIPNIIDFKRIKPFHTVQSILELIDDTLLPWTGIIIHFIFQEKISWGTFVQAIIESTGDLNANESLAHAKINEWAKHKVYAVASGLVTPEKELATFGAFDEKCIDKEGVETERSVVYKYSKGRDPGTATPISFSTKLGAHPSSFAPYPFMHLPDDIEFELTYAVQNKSSLISFGAIIEETETIIRKTPGPGMRSNHVPLKDAIATSSAFLSESFSIYEKTGPMGMLLNAIGLWDDALAFVMAASLSPHVEPSKMFESAYEALNQHPNRKCDQFARHMLENHVMTVTDGGYIDNSALSFLLSDAKNGDAFTLILNNKNFRTYGDVNSLFQGFNSSAKTLFPVFAQDQSYVNAATAKFKSLQVSENATLLNGISFGSLVGTTVNVPYFGVTAGKNITIHVFMVSSPMPIAPEDWYDPARLVGDITSTMLASENADAIYEILDRFF